ncbi:hypothetical protein [Mycobacterium sp. OTB74]|jgi:hypothetical protein|uniref:hypothetical protein n=1 Tax=Mycobacterium sp. OTB74 TaxID=1853452 RepID=UPI00247303AC|nr:hypothetical protein [Mycobacterium sp. OTB74]MDH6247256.1 hypothetical protein [Mycobacterium sp. OTB74]
MVTDSPTTPAVALPLGAEFAGDWEHDDPGISDVQIRHITSPELRITDSPVTVLVSAIQREDGAMIDAAMCINLGDHSLNAAQCRELAAHLLVLAPLLDAWSQGAIDGEEAESGS